MTNPNPDPIKVDTPTTPIVSDTDTPKVTAESQARELAKQNKILNERIQAYEQAKAKEETDKLVEQGKFKELLELEKKEKETLIKQYETDKRTNLYIKELQKSGVPAELVDLIDLKIFSGVTFDASNNPTNLVEVISNLKASKPSLFTPTLVPATVGVSSTTSTSTTGGMSKEEAIRLLRKPDLTEYYQKQQEVDNALAR